MLSSSPLLEVHNLSRRHPGGFELHSTSFSLSRGTTHAILGLNGAGKSTLFQLLSANSFAASGTILLLGKVLRPEHYALKKNIGYLPQNLQLPPWISGKELLHYAARLYEIPAADQRISHMLDYWDCQSFAQLALGACSHGMQKRLALSLALLHDPLLLILDEPFSGLDLHHTRALEREILARRENGKLTILSTHVIPYVVDLCQSTAILDRGQLTHLEGWETGDDLTKKQRIEDFFFRDQALANGKSSRH